MAFLIELRMGLKMTKIHRVILFKQDCICRGYIHIINRKAIVEKNNEDMRKIMNKTLIGRICMNLLTFTLVKFLHDDEKIVEKSVR